MKMKRIMMTILSVMLLIILCSCGNEHSGDPIGTEDVAVTTGGSPETNAPETDPPATTASVTTAPAPVTTTPPATTAPVTTAPPPATTVPVTTAPPATTAPVIDSLSVSKSMGFTLGRKNDNSEIIGKPGELVGIYIYSAEQLKNLKFNERFDITVKDHYNGRTFETICAKYDKEYFEDNVLIICYGHFENLTECYEFETAISENTITVYYQKVSANEEKTEKKMYYGFVAEIKKHSFESCKLPIEHEYNIKTMYGRLMQYPSTTDENLPEVTDFSCYYGAYKQNGLLQEWGPLPDHGEAFFSKEELEKYFTNSYKERFKFDYTVTTIDYPESVNNILEKYDDNFFKENVLFILDRCTLVPSKTEITKIKSDGKNLEIHTEFSFRVIDNVETEPYYYYIVFVELPKNALNNETEVKYFTEYGIEYFSF